MSYEGTPTNTVEDPLALPANIGTGDLGPSDVLGTRINAIAPATYAPAEATPYLGTALRGPEIYESRTQADEAIAYANSVFPDATFSFLGAGRYGIVLADETGMAFKVYRSALHYSKYEREAGALKMLSDAGLAPRMHLFVDAGREYRLDRKAYDYDKRVHGFEGVTIPRQDSGKELPVLVMDRVDTAPIKNAEPDKLASGFGRAAALFLRHNIRSWDAEVGVNVHTDEAIFLDVGGLWQAPFDAESVTPQAKMQHELEIIRDLGFDFGLGKVERELAAKYREGGLEAVCAFIVTVPLDKRT